MVKFIRRFRQPAMLIFAILSVITLGSFYGHTDFLDRSHANHVGEIYGRNVSMAEIQRAVRMADLCMQMGMSDLYEALAVNARDAQKNFIWNSMVLKHECEKLGLEPNDDEIFEATKQIPAFQENGVYNPTKYNFLTQIYLFPRGFSRDDLADLIGDGVRVKKIKALLGSTVAPSEAQIRELFTESNQKIEAAVLRFKLADFLAATQVSDEDVKKVYEERKATLKSDELRKVKYVAFVIPAPAKPDEKPLEGKARGDALTELQKKAEDFAVTMTDKNAKLDEVAAKAGAKVQESPDFAATAPADVLAGSREAIVAAFKLNEAQPNSDVVETPNGYFVLQLVNITPPHTLSFEEAKPKLADSLKHERAQETLTEKAAEARNKIEEAMKGGLTFAAAAQAQGLKAEDFPAFSEKDPKMDQPNSSEIMQAAFDLKEGQMSSATATGDGSVIVYCAKRLPIDEKELEKDKAEVASRLRDLESKALFQEWIKLRRASAQIKNSELHG